MNMSYCRFQNTLKDLEDCNNHLFDNVSDEEDEALKKLIRLCSEIAIDDFEEGEE